MKAAATSRKRPHGQRSDPGAGLRVLVSAVHTKISTCNNKMVESQRIDGNAIAISIRAGLKEQIL
jgi:hypothetical protein